MVHDIVSLLYRIKGNIRDIETTGSDESLLNEIEADFLGFIDFLKLFLISKRDSYYGYFMMNLQFNVDFYSSIIAGIKLNSYPPIFITNPLLLCKFTLKEIIYIFSHEIDHIVLNHPTEMVRINPDMNPDTLNKFNLAADASVNDRINKEIRDSSIKFMNAPEGTITSTVLGNKFGIRSIKPLESYAHYFNLIRHLPIDMNENNNQPERMMSALLKETDGENNKETIENGENNTNEEKVVTADAFQIYSDHKWDAGHDIDDVKANVREFVNAATSMMNEEIRGLMPGAFLSQVKRLNKPPVLTWQAILKKYVGTIAASKLKTRTRLNRRQPNRFDIAGTRVDKVLKIVIAIDTSASVSDIQLAEIFHEIFAILALRKHEVTIIECDTHVRRVYTAKSAADIKNKVKGRGGTLFSPVIDYINKDRYFRDALLVYFTDGFGEPKIPKPRTYRNLWIILGNTENLSLKEPYGVKVALKSTDEQ